MPIVRADTPWIRLGLLVAVVAGIAIAASDAVAEPPSEGRMPSLDEQVQEIKSEVLDIAAELARLEEQLLYPSNTQVAVFVSLAESARDEDLRLDSIRVEIDGEPAAHHIYRFEELEALRKGGVQRLHTGNVATGEHRIEVSVRGRRPGGGDFEDTQSFAFRKEVEPKLLGITLGGDGPGPARLQVGDW